MWGTGTAIGEIPPYAFSYHAAKAGIRNEEWDSMFKVKPVSEGQGFFEALLNRMKNWMLDFIQRCAVFTIDPHILAADCLKLSQHAGGCSCLRTTSLASHPCCGRIVGNMNGISNV